MTTEDIQALFSKAFSALTDLQAAMEHALLYGRIENGRFSIKRGEVSAELQWPYEGWYDGKTQMLPARFILQGVILPTSRSDQPEPELAPICGDPSCDDGAF